MAVVDLYAWAQRWGVSPLAVHELQREMMQLDPTTIPHRDSEPVSEGAAQAEVRLEACEKGHRLWRNNSGALMDKDGRLVRYGLMNDSKKVNEVIKSGDLIGIRRRTITTVDVGTVIGQFMMRECKQPGWRYSASPRERAQLAGLELVNGLGGDACFAIGRGTI